MFTLHFYAFIFCRNVDSRSLEIGHLVSHRGITASYIPLDWDFTLEGFWTLMINCGGFSTHSWRRRELSTNSNEKSNVLGIEPLGHSVVHDGSLTTSPVRSYLYNCDSRRLCDPLLTIFSQCPKRNRCGSRMIRTEVVMSGRPVMKFDMGGGK